jgi:hypothetical protein
VLDATTGTFLRVLGAPGQFSAPNHVSVCRYCDAELDLPVASTRDTALVVCDAGVTLYLFFYFLFFQVCVYFLYPFIVVPNQVINWFTCVMP